MSNSDPRLSNPNPADQGVGPMLCIERSKRWELLIQHINGWRRPLAPGDGYPVEKLDEAEAKLGFRLPAASNPLAVARGRSYEMVA